MVTAWMRACVMAGSLLLALAAGDAAIAADALNTTDFLAACTTDQVVIDEPGLGGASKITPQSYCECIVEGFAAAKLSQSDVDMLTKFHKDEITDEDAATYATLEDLMRANEGIEDACKEKLGMPAGDDGEEGEQPLEGEDIPQDE